MVWRIATWKVMPRRPRAKYPEHAAEDVSRIAIRTTTHTFVDRLFLRENRLDQSPLLFSDVHIKVRSEIDPPVDPLPKSDRVSRT